MTDHYLRQPFRGARIQRGYGIGGIFKSVARIAIPLFKRNAKTLGKKALKAATEVGQNVLKEKNHVESRQSVILQKWPPTK